MYEYSVRGLTTSEFYKDGFSVNRGYMNPPDAASIERVEVLKDHPPACTAVAIRAAPSTSSASGRSWIASPVST